MASDRLTIQDIADRLGLSKFSVSRALSGKPGVADATRSRVLRMAHSMGYRGHGAPPPASGQILFLRQEIDPVSSELWLNMLHGAEEEAARHGHSIVPRQASCLEAPRQLDSAVLGLILAVPRPADVVPAALRTGLPVVSASYVEPLERLDQVVGADWEAGVGVARLLLRLGHRQLAFVHGSATPLGRAERFRGFRDGLHAGAGTTAADIVFDEAAGFRGAFLRHVADGGAPTALFCAHDGIAVNVVSELLRLGIRVPDDISIVGFNDFAAASQVVPRLTTVRTPQAEIGSAMVRCIIARLGSPAVASRPPMRLSLVAEIIERDSTAPVGATAWLPALRKLATPGAGRHQRVP